MPISLTSFIAAASSAEHAARILVDNKNPEAAPTQQAFATGCFACLRNKLANKSSLNRMTIETFTESIRNHYDNDFVAQFVEEALRTRHRKGKPLTANTLMLLTTQAEALFNDMQMHDKNNKSAHIALKYAQALLTPDSPAHTALLDSIHTDCADLVLKDTAPTFWPRAAKRISHELQAFLTQKDISHTPEALLEVARNALAHSLTRAIPFDRFYEAAADAANERLGNTIYSHEYMTTKHPCVEELNRLLLDAQLQQWSIYTLERGFHHIVTQMVRSPFLTAEDNMFQNASTGAHRSA